MQGSGRDVDGPRAGSAVRLLLLLLLAGCASTPPQVVTAERTQIVRVPTPIPCQVQIPERPKSALPEPTADVARKAAGASADVRALRIHSDALEAALRACAAGGTP